MFDLLQEFLALIRTFGEEGLDYAVCGGMAMAVPGFTRATEDIDILIEPESLNRARQAAAKCGFRLRGTEIEFRSGTKLARLLKVTPAGEAYLLLAWTLISPETRAAWDSRLDQPTPWVPIRVVGREALKSMKQQAGRPQDLVDVERMDTPDDLT